MQHQHVANNKIDNKTNRKYYLKNNTKQRFQKEFSKLISNKNK